MSGKSPSLLLRALAAWALTTAALLSGFFTLRHWNSLWNGGDFYSSSAYYRAMDNKVDQAVSLGELLCRKESASLSYLEDEMAGQLALELMPQNTNFRFSLHTVEGQRIYDNTGGAAVGDVADGLTLHTFSTSYTNIPENSIFVESDDITVTHRSLVMEYGLDKTLPVADELSDAVADYHLTQTLLPFLALVALVCTAGAVTATVFLCLALRKTDISLKKPPFDLLCFLLFLAAGMLYNLALPALYAFLSAPWRSAPLLASAVFCALWAAMGLAALAALVYQWRRGLWRNCLLGRCWAEIKHLHLSRRPAVSFLLYVLGGMLLALPFYNALWENTFWPLPALPFLLYQFVALRLFLRRDRDQRAALDATMAETVEREIRAQRFQAELITNVSHDLRSPLTSIINYVDLLKKAGPDAAEAAEYLNVLERKSQRLKKLTDDLIEASKASSGVLPVSLETLGLKELVEQASAEYDDRFEAAGLTLVVDAPADEVAVTADGRHLWRVLDNLLSNCAKYSLPGSRVYLSISAADAQGVITLKNISAEGLNIPADELMSRFVRGDHSRTDGGSGLGLSIAESLTKLQNGTFSLDIDGDLFKATVSLPLAAPPDPALPAAADTEDAAHG